MASGIGRNGGCGKSSKQGAEKPGFCRSRLFRRADCFFFLQYRVLDRSTTSIMEIWFYFLYTFLKSQQSNYVHDNIQNPQVAWRRCHEIWFLMDTGPVCPLSSTCVSLHQQISLWARADTDPKDLGSDLTPNILQNCSDYAAHTLGSCSYIFNLYYWVSATTNSILNKQSQ